jgi:hypothetical protein
VMSTEVLSTAAVITPVGTADKHGWMHPLG